MCMCELVVFVHCVLLFVFAYYMGCTMVQCGLITFRGGAGDQAHGTCGCEHRVFGLFQGSHQVPPTTRQDRNTRVNYNYVK